MISEPEYNATVADIKQLGAVYDQLMQDDLPDLDKNDAIKAAKVLATGYYKDVDDTIQSGLFEVAANAADAYELDELPESLVKAALAERYFGLSYKTRMIANYVRLKRKIDKTAAVGTGHLGGIYTQPFPNGAQVNTDATTFRGYVIKVEQDVAKKAADAHDFPLVKWTLAENHAKTCMCDELASMVNKEVVEYLKENQLDIDPKGLFFVKDLPRPPHPNCRCNFELAGKGGSPRKGVAQRSADRVRNLIRRIRAK